MITDIKKNINQKYIQISKEQWETYSNLIDLISHERDKINWDYIKSNNTQELFNYLDN